MTPQRPILAIIGTTASGKSDLAMAVAAQTGGEILSVDSMQVYRGLDIGTAKPSPEQRRQVPHHLLDVVDPDQTFTAARFVDLSDDAIADARRRGAPLIAAGGTPLYYKLLVQGLFEGPQADHELRSRLRELSGEELSRRLATVDPEAAARIHPNDTKRLVRALEVHELSGRPISQHQTEWQRADTRHPVVWIGLDWDRGELNRRINARVKAMLAAGWLEETRGLLSRYGQLSPSASQAAGYMHLISHLRGDIPLEDAAEQIKVDTRQLARRQAKWFRRFPGVTWLSGSADLETNAGAAISAWQSASHEAR